MARAAKQIAGVYKSLTGGLAVAKPPAGSISGGREFMDESNRPRTLSPDFKSQLFLL